MPGQVQNEIIENGSVSTSFKNFITQTEATSLVNRVLGPEATLCNFVLKPYSDGKLGFLGSHWRLKIEAQLKNQIRSLYFFVKTVPYEIPTQAEYVIGKGVFQHETAFYREVMSELCMNYKGEPWAPQCHLVKNDLLLFEDLSIKNFSMKDKLLDRKYVMAGLSTIARLHASSLIAEARLGKSLKKIFPHAFEEKGFAVAGPTRKWFDAGVDVAIAVAEQLRLPTSFIRNACEGIHDAIKESSSKPNVVVHGDLWSNNLLFNNDTVPKCLLVDFQLVRYASLVNDVSQFLYLCTDRSFRQVWEKKMLEYYYENLCNTLKSSNIPVQVPSWSDILEGMEEQRLAAVVTAVAYFPTVLLDADLGARILNDPVSYNTFVFEDRTKAVLENMKQDLEYGRRITEIVTELVELSLRLDELPKPT